MRPSRTLALVVPAIATGLLAIAPPVGAGVLPGGGGGGGACRGFTRGSEVTLVDSCFDGVTMLVEPGTTELSVTNTGAAPHTITAVDGSFDLRLEPGASGTVAVALDDTPVVPVYCTLHGTADGVGMAGVVVVDGAPVSRAGATGFEAEPAAAVSPADPSSGSAAGWAVLGSVGLVLVGALGAAGLQRRRATA